MDVEVFDVDLAAAGAEFSGQKFGESGCPVPAACSLAYSELLPNINRSRVVCSSPRQAGLGTCDVHCICPMSTGLVALGIRVGGRAGRRRG